MLGEINKTKLLLALTALATVNISLAGAGTISNLSLDVDGLSATALIGPMSLIGPDRHGTIATAGQFNQNVTRGDVASGATNATAMTIRFQSDQDSVCHVLKDNVSSGSMASNDFAFDGEINLSNGSIIGGMLRLTSLSDNAVVQILVGANGVLRPVAGSDSYLISNEQSEGSVSSASLNGIDVGLWSERPGAANFLAVRFSPTGTTMTDSNVDLDISIASVVVVPLPSPLISGSLLLAGCAAISKLKAFRRA